MSGEVSEDKERMKAEKDCCEYCTGVRDQELPEKDHMTK